MGVEESTVDRTKSLRHQESGRFTGEDGMSSSDSLEVYAGKGLEEKRGQIRKRADQSTVGATASGEMVNVN